MSDISIHDRDTLAFRVKVLREGTSAAQPLTGATVLVLAARQGGASIAGAASVPVPASGEIDVFFAAGMLSQGAWVVQVTVTIGLETQTVAVVVVSVLRSHSDP